MDNRLQSLIQFTDQAIADAEKAVRDQDKDARRRVECRTMIQKLKDEIAAEQKELAAEKKKSAALTTRRKKLDRDMKVLQKKLDGIVSQIKNLKSCYVGRMGAVDVVDEAVLSDESTIVDPVPAVKTDADLTVTMDMDVAEHECKQWTMDMESVNGHREPETVPDMKSPTRKRNGHYVSPKGKKGRKSPATKKRKLSASESDSGEAPKKRAYRRRIIDMDGTLSKLSSEFKRDCSALLTSFDLNSSEAIDENECRETSTAMDCNTTEEMAIITSPRTGMPVELRCASHKFRPENIITVPHRLNVKDFEAKLNLIRSCPNLRVLCLVGLHQRLQTLAVENLTLSECCPKLEHFILDGALVDLAIAYQENKPGMIRVVEIKNEKQTEAEVIHLLTMDGSDIRSVYLTHSSVDIIQMVAPRVTCLSLCWITDNEFQSLIKCSKNSQISDLMLETVDLTMDAAMIAQLAEALPNLQSLKLSGPLEHIHGLQCFPNLRHVVFDAECQSKQTIDPNFPIDMSRALELSRQQDNGLDVVIKEEEDDEENLSQHNTTCQISLNKFLDSCGRCLMSFSITIRERFKKDFFHQLWRSCPVLQELTVLSIFEQFFDPKSLSLPSLHRLSLQFVQISDAKLIEVLDICRNLNFISIDKPRKISSACISVLRYYGEEIFSKRQLLTDQDKFTAIIQTEGRDEVDKRILSSRLDITFKQKAVAEISSRLRYKY